jgi:PAS domain S-box
MADFQQKKTLEQQFGGNIYRLIFDSSPEAIVLLDTKGTFIEANGRLFDWIGVKPVDVIGKNILTIQFLTVKSKAVVAKNFAERILGQNILPYDIEFVGKNGEIKIGRVIGTPIKDQTGKVLGDLVMISEVTELKRIEYSLKEKVNELERLNKLMVDRELKMAEMKKRMKEFSAKS